uniref:Uncharacterized protein n=1 Tax=Setaria viridis TaxID=4556 RepID=A0A4U6ULT4_SETVI|nr:hypothetical protein SEVIR_5G212740v2 [Setaria viridis]
MTAEVPPGPSTDVVLESRINTVSGSNENCQELHMHIAKKRNTIMTSLLTNENDADDAAERAAREIKFFPLSLNHGLPSSDFEFFDYEMSSIFGGAFDVEMDLSLNLSSSSGESGIKVDLSLKL